MNLEKLEKSKKDLLEQLEERKKLKKLKKKTPEESAFSDKFGNKKGRMIDGQFYPAMAKGGRAGLKGGGICKRGMNRKAVGKNS